MLCLSSVSPVQPALADEASSTLIVPANLSDIASMIALATNVVKTQTAKPG